MFSLRLLSGLLAFQLTFVSALVTEPAALSKHGFTGNDEEMLFRDSRYKVLSCGKQILPVGVYAIQSANYNDDHTMNYDGNIDCKYSFEAAEPEGKLHFQCFFFQLEDSPKCIADYLQINGGSKYCGQNPPQPIISDTLDIHFATDYEHGDKGFFCTIMSKDYGAGCDGQSLPCGTHSMQAGSTYSLLSKNYPDNYDVLQYCKWELNTINAQDIIEVACNHFDIESYDGSCKWDWVKVDDGKIYCNKSPLPASVKLVGGGTVEYTTSNLPDKTRQGFNCTVTVKASHSNKPRLN